MSSATLLKRIILLIACLFSLHTYAQRKVSTQKMDGILEGDEKRKVERARKLFNKYKIYEGEKILKELIALHPNDFYYHEALVQLQAQVLGRIVDAGELLTELNPSHLEFDSTDKDENGTDSTLAKEALKLKSNTEVNSYNGLAGSEGEKNEVDNKKTKKEKRREARFARNASEAPLQDAVMTIDSNLLKINTDEEEEGGDADIFVRKERTSNEHKRQLKMLTDLAQIPYEPYKQDLIKNARNATRLSPFCDTASHYLRMMLIDTLNPDIQANAEAQEAFQEGMEEMYAGNSADAAKLFERAITLYPMYYAAHMHLGDVYYKMNRDTAAMRKYHQASILVPYRPDPLARLAMIQYNNGKYKESAALIIEAMLIYPEHQYMALLKRIMSKTGREFDSRWMSREVFPILTSHTWEEIVAKEKTPWWHYQFAKGGVYGYYDTLGLVRPNEKTSEPYLEMYGWKFMLNRSGIKHFPFARLMQEIGYLDCYVFISLFHHDIYGQYADFVSHEPDKVRKYFYLLMNWEDKKYEKLRKRLAELEKAGEKKVTEPATSPEKVSGEKK